MWSGVPRVARCGLGSLGCMGNSRLGETPTALLGSASADLSTLAAVSTAGDSGAGCNGGSGGDSC